MYKNFKKTVLSTILILASTSSIAKVDVADASYVVGNQIGNKISSDLAKTDDLGFNLDKKMLIKGISDVLYNSVSLSEEEMKLVLIDLNAQVIAANKAKTEKLIKNNPNKIYLDENKKKKGVVTTESGLQYEVITKGEGKKPSASDTVEVNYKGTFIDGKEFDSSYKRNKSISFKLNQVIKGWTEGLQLMEVGSKYKFTIPYDLAYGERGNSNIPGGSTLIFEVELLDVK